MPSWTKKPVARAALWASGLTAIAVGYYLLAGAYFGKFFFAGPSSFDVNFVAAAFLAGLLALPGALIASLIVGRDNLDRFVWLIPLLDAAFYFLVFFLLFRWRARRRATRESAAAASGAAPIVSSRKKTRGRAAYWAAAIVLGLAAATIALMVWMPDRIMNHIPSWLLRAPLYPGEFVSSHVQRLAARMISAENVPEAIGAFFFLGVNWCLYFAAFTFLLRWRARRRARREAAAAGRT
ncbi:MAG: hypothetical protein WAM91_13260 [Candidatus Acidiferrales bacterium]